MKTSQILLAIILVAALTSSLSFAQENTASPNAPSIPSDSPVMTSPSPAATLTSPSGGQSSASGQPSAADMQRMMTQMMELSKPGENHKLLADMAGTWTYNIKMWMNPDPNAPAQRSTGTATRKPIMDGRYFVMDVSGKMQMPGPDGKMKDVNFKGMSIEGYDNVKKKFIAAWIDNMGTGIEFSDGTYDPATKTFTYNSEMEPMPGMKTQVREVIKIVDNNHHTLEWYENRGGAEAKTMEINYTRKK
jgi:hypothetical protein